MPNGDHNLARRIARIWTSRTAGYYNYRNESIAEIIRKWQEDGDKLRGPDKISTGSTTLYAHGMFPTSELWKYREYTWSKFDARRSPTEWDDLLKSIKAEGLREPLHFQIGRKGGAKVAEGNHRLAIARQLGMHELPVVFHFYDDKVTKTKIDKIPTQQPHPTPKIRKELEKVKEKEVDLSPEERKKRDEQIEDLLKIMGF